MKVKRFEFNMFGENTYIVFDERTRHAAIIDPGMLNQRENTMFSGYIDDNKLIIRYLITTHIHIDHVLGIEYVENKYGVGLSASPDDAFLAKRVAQQAEMFHLPINVPEEIKLAQNLTEGDELPLGDDALEVINVPGHSPGSIALYSAKSEIVFTGDALFKSSIGRTDLPGGDYAQLIQAIQSKLLTLPDKTIVYPGHGPSTTIGQEKTFNPYV